MRWKNRMKTKYLFLDIDGTLVNFDGTMPKSTEEALIAAQKNGHKLIICTGRCCGQIYPWMLEKISFDGIISSSGARVKYGGKNVCARLFSREQLSYLTECFKKTGASGFVHFDNTLAATKADFDGINRQFDEINYSMEARKTLFGNLNIIDSIITDGVERVVYCGSSLELDAMRAFVGDEFVIDVFSLKGMPDTGGELNLAGVTKASGIEALIKHLGASMEDTIAFGDNWNDITMIRAAGYSVLMGNAPEAMKPEADYVTDSIDNDGIMKAFVHLGLI